MNLVTVLLLAALILGTLINRVDARALTNPADAAAARTLLGSKGDGKYYSTADPKLSGDMVHEILGLFETWNAALATGDPTKVAALYARDGVLVPTASNVVRSTRAGITDYFVNWLVNEPQGVIDEYGIREEAVDSDGVSTVVSNSGIYTFTYGLDGTKVQARFSYVYKKENGEWKILSHHSSQMPSKLIQAPYTAPGGSCVTRYWLNAGNGYLCGETYYTSSTADDQLTEPEVQGVLDAFKMWSNALKTLDPEQVIALYADDAILLPTQSDDVRTTKDERRDYFVHFLKLHPVGELDEYHIRLIGRDALGLPNAVSNQGIYTFTVEGGEKVQARFTYNYERDACSNMWLIKKHHSSGMPEATKP